MDRFRGCCHNADCDGFENCDDCWNDYKANHQMTNADCIRSLSDEELAKWLSICGCPDAFSFVSGCEEGKCEECWMVYLKQPYKEDA